MSDTEHGVVIVGAGLGGIRVAESLRSGGYSGPITLVGDENHPPYDRPPLSKSVLLGKQDRVDLKPEEFYGDSAITLRTGTPVTAVTPGEHTVTVGSGGDAEVLAYDTLVLATGLRPRPFPGSPAKGVHVIRSVDDALALRAESASASNAVVIGAGFIGCEAAASLRTRGLTVTLVEPAPTPLAVALGEKIGGLVTRLHVANGVEVRSGVGVEMLVSQDDQVTAVRLTDGTEIPADIVVVGIGSTPVVEFLDGSGIELAPRESGGGVACDAVGRTSADDVYAVGDVANWLTVDGVPTRVEHWNHTVEQAAIVAHHILGSDDDVVAAVPYFWSDQYDVKVQVLGWPKGTDDVHVIDDDGKKFVAYFSRDGVLTAVAGGGKAGAVMKMRAKLQASTPIAELL
ncbi:NAD(P)/FAD-dependent oxidoreductase [Gordonia sp. TBRC 11910]|uniref:NAD(P)/FAD-dependent oxidoreductase n=1 Tax=Gordonia asplenii TaxID=2725283 RepID=A0A848L0N0_9ACTN|nr:FAD/NAD(P)-binding oxidoreductase [Gordonia asplenii]NMO02193.1 NAD(P)/FAD-dependent oxidoreductase [Gordonia asplenii]